MAEKWKLGLPKYSMCLDSLETRKRTELLQARAQGHTCVELRDVGHELNFFCALCLEHCGNNLQQHVRGAKHMIRLNFARNTLIISNPWPFNDGFKFFFYHSDESQKASEKLVINDGTNLEQIDRMEIVIPDVLQNNKVSDLTVYEIGWGLISGKCGERVPSQIDQIWCEWLGENHAISVSGSGANKHKFGILVLSYDYNLGIPNIIDDFRFFVPFTTYCEGPNKGKSEAKTSIGRQNTYQLNGTTRDKLKEQYVIAADRKCRLCMQEFLPNKDVAALLNTGTKNLACHTKNSNGEFHVFHVSCLLLWVMLCESDKTIRRTICPTCQGSGEAEAEEDPLLSEDEINEMIIKQLEASEGWFKSPKLLDKCSIGLDLSEEKHQGQGKRLKYIPFFHASITQEGLIYNELEKEFVKSFHKKN